MSDDEQHIASVRALAKDIGSRAWNESVKDYNLRIALDLLTRAVGLLTAGERLPSHAAWEDIERKMDLAHRAVGSPLPKS